MATFVVRKKVYPNVWDGFNLTRFWLKLHDTVTIYA